MSMNQAEENTWRATTTMNIIRKSLITILVSEGRFCFLIVGYILVSLMSLSNPKP